MEDNSKYKTVYIDKEVDKEDINLREEYEKYSYYYKWFLLAFLIAVITAFLYIRYTSNQYEVNASILIDDKENGGGLNSELSAFKDLGLLGDSKTSLETEIDVLKSRTLMQRVVKELGINVIYYTQGKIGKSELYDNEIPYKLNFLVRDSILYQLDTTFSISTNSDNKFFLKNSDGETVSEIFFGKKVTTEFGDLIITPINVQNINTDLEINIKISPLKAVANYYKEAIKIEPGSKKSSVLVFTLIDPIKQKAQNILNSLIDQYNKDAIEDKNLVAKNTDDFINNRIEDISTELTNVDRGVEIYKTENKLTNIEFEASLVLESNSDLEKEIVDLTSEIRLIDYVSAHMKNNEGELIPSNLGLRDQTTSQSTLNYNKLILEKNRILAGSSDMNPTVVNLEAQIATLKESINRSLANLRSSLVFSLDEAKLQENRLNVRRALAPKQEREFQDIKRKQQIIETLYLYLLEKREENAITLAVTAPNAKIIDQADGSEIPISPKKKLIYLVFVIIGFITTFIIISIKISLDTKIHTLEDVKRIVKAPILGDIPKINSEKKVIISDQDRSNVAESFRLLRTNVNFMLRDVKLESKTIFVSSTIASEGKTFIAINLASALSLSNKKVLLIGADIRKPKIAKYLNIHSDKGLTHFLSDPTLIISDIIEHYEKADFDILQSGVIPPNPSELLMNERFDEVLAYGKEKYDYVIVDTSPVNVVTDTLLLSHHADLFIYVIRANYLDKRLLKIPQMMFENKRLANMALLINDTEYDKKGYGYTYGYGYGYSERESKTPWWKKFLKI